MVQRRVRASTTLDCCDLRPWRRKRSLVVAGRRFHLKVKICIGGPAANFGLGSGLGGEFQDELLIVALTCRGYEVHAEFTPRNLAVARAVAPNVSVVSNWVSVYKFPKDQAT